MRVFLSESAFEFIAFEFIAYKFTADFAIKVLDLRQEYFSKHLKTTSTTKTDKMLNKSVNLI